MYFLLLTIQKRADSLLVLLGWIVNAFGMHAVTYTAKKREVKPERSDPSLSFDGHVQIMVDFFFTACQQWFKVE